MNNEKLNDIISSFAKKKDEMPTKFSEDWQDRFDRRVKWAE